MNRRFTAPITLPGDPTGALEAAPKQYVDLRQLLSGKGVAGGYAGLDASADVPYANLPVGTTPGSTVADGGHTHTADLVGVTRAARQTADLAVTSSTTGSLTSLSLPCSAGGIYIFQGLLLYTSTATDVKCFPVPPSGASVVGTAALWAGLDPAGTVAAGIGSSTFEAADTVGVLNASSVAAGSFFGFTLTVGATAGNLALQFAQNVANATASTCKAGSFMTALRVA